MGTFRVTEAAGSECLIVTVPLVLPPASNILTGLCHRLGPASLWMAQDHPLPSGLLILQGPNSNLINPSQPFLLPWKKGSSESPVQKCLAALCYGYCNHP